MIGHIKVRERGATPGILAKEWRAVSKVAWRETGVVFHRDYLPKRFTHEGARLLNYTRRKGELMKGSKRYWRTYTGRKERRFGHTLPMVYTGESRQLARVRDVRSTSNGVKVVLNARKLNFRHPKSQVRMNIEIRRVAPVEAEQIARHHDKHIGWEFNEIKLTKFKEL